MKVCALQRHSAAEAAARGGGRKARPAQALGAEEERGARPRRPYEPEAPEDPARRSRGEPTRARGGEGRGPRAKAA
eukprot:5587280-Pyramimonas_sp.AAC.1